MAEPSQLNGLALRRQALVARSNELRRQIANQWSVLESHTTWVERAYDFAQSGRALWPLLAGVVGLLFARGTGGLLSKSAQLVSWWRMGKKLFNIWQSLQSR